MSRSGQHPSRHGRYQASQPWVLEPWALAGTRRRLAWCILPQLRRLGSLCPESRIKVNTSRRRHLRALAMSANRANHLEGVGGCASERIERASPQAIDLDGARAGRYRGRGNDVMGRLSSPVARSPGPQAIRRISLYVRILCNDQDQFRVGNLETRFDWGPKCGEGEADRDAASTS